MAGLVLEGVSRRFGGLVAVDAVSLAAGPGEVVCLLGPSGCGKTTALRLAAGLEVADAGEIRVGGRVVDGGGTFVPPEQRKVGLVFQDYALFPHLTAIENVKFGVRGTDREETAREMLARVGMTAQAASYPHTLSGGEQQRVALARALAPRPTVMLMDEPFSGLDFRLRDRVGEESLSLLRELGTATLMVTHDSEEAMRLADRVALMRAGRIVQQGLPTQIYQSPVDEGAAEFFSEINRLEGVVDAGTVDTPVGPVAAPGLPAGTPVTVVFRPESVRIGQGGGAAATVLRVRPMGPWTLAVLKPQGSEATLLARLPPGGAPSPGEAVQFGLDPDSCFVFSGKGLSA